MIGVAGTGKTFLVEKMKGMKLNAIDADDDLATLDADGNELKYDVNGGAKWWKSHYYVLRLDKLEKLLRKCKTLYLFGDVGGRPGKKNGLVDVAQLFDRVCYLQAPMALTRLRLAQRTNNPFGKNPGEVEGVRKHKGKMDRIAKKMGFEVINATLPADKIIKIPTE